MWIKILETYSGKEGVFLGGHIYEMTESKIRAINADLKNRRLGDFKYEETVAPHLQGADPDRIAIQNARQQLGRAQSDLTDLREKLKGQEVSKATAEVKIAEFEKIGKVDREKTPVKQFCVIAEAQLQIAEAKIELIESEAKEHEAAIKVIEKQITKLDGKLTAKTRSAAKKERKANRK